MQGRGQGIKVVKFDCHRRGQQILHLPDQAWPVDRFPIAQVYEHIIHRTMIAAVEDQYLVPARNSTTPADDGPVRFARRRRHLPLWQAEHFGEHGTEFRALCGRQHVA